MDAMESIDFPAAGRWRARSSPTARCSSARRAGSTRRAWKTSIPTAGAPVFAVEAVREAIKEPHLQDALQPYRQKWGTTLGEYLRGPQQNLRFLLPLVYRNPTMTRLMAESILQGKPVVR